MAEKKSLIKTKKKYWFDIIAPNMFNNIVLGSTLLYDSNQLIGKKLSINLMTLLNDYKKQNTNLEFKINMVKDNKGYADVVGYNLSPSSIKRLVRRGYIKMDQSFYCETLDKKGIIVKSLMLISAKCKGSLRSLIRSLITQFLRKQISKMTYENFISDIITNRIQRALHARVKKIYPLRVCEIRRFILLEGDNFKKKIGIKEIEEAEVSENINTKKEDVEIEETETGEKKAKQVKVSEPNELTSTEQV